MKTTECKNKEIDRRLQRQCINGINDQAMMAEIIKINCYNKHQ